MSNLEISADLLARLEQEIQHQRNANPDGFPATRNGLRLGIAALEDEIYEVYAEWDRYKKSVGWGDNIQRELIQVAAIAMQLVMSLEVAP